MNEVADLLGGLDGVVAVAGRMMAGEISSGTPERWRELFDLNFVGSTGHGALCDGPISQFRTT